MESFYGGRKGDSINVVARYTDTIDVSGNIIKTAAEDLVADFRQGALTTSKVGYGEYVLINTSYSKNENNGNLYRRGFDYSAEPVYKIRNLTAQRAHFPQESANIIAAAVGKQIADYFEPTDKGYVFRDPEEAAKIEFPQGMLDALSKYEINFKHANKSYHSFYLYSGAGAEYLGRILGPIGNTPEVDVEHYDIIEERVEDVGHMDYSIVNNDMYEAGPTDEQNMLHINWVNVEDRQGNVESWLVGFKMPYLKPVFKTVNREPYIIEDEVDEREGLSLGTVLPDGFDKLITENEEVKKPFYHEWLLHIPRGVKGTSLNHFTFDNVTSKLSAVFRTFDRRKEGELQEPVEIGTLNMIEQLYITKGETGDGIPAGHLVVAYSYDKDGPIDYDGKHGLYDLGVARGDDAGNLVLYARLPFADAAALDAFVTALNNTDIEPNSIYNIYYPSQDKMNSTVAADSSKWTREYSGDPQLKGEGVGLLLTYDKPMTSDAIVETVAYSCLYDYSLGEWYKTLLTAGDVIAPEQILTADANFTKKLVQNGYYFTPIDIPSVYDKLATLSGQKVLNEID